MFRGIRAFAVVGVLALVVVAAASAAWGGKDPSRGTRMLTMPSSCKASPAGKTCIDAGIYYIDKARGKAGLGPLKLPANFPSLSPTKQMFILVNLDRIAYHLTPIPGLTSALNHDALVHGVWRVDDPYPSHTSGLSVWWPGWAGAFYNVPMAYETLVWNDGLGSTNPRCTSTDHSRCWGHRHSVLWKYGSHAAMGAAAGRGSDHKRGYAYLFVGGSSSYHPRFTYTWKAAVKAGAGTNTYDPGPSPGSMCHVPIAIGMELPGARRAIEKGHCTVGDVVKKNSDYAAGVIYKQSPGPGTTYARGKPVTLTISLGPST
jgi:hypothetical protein